MNILQLDLRETVIVAILVLYLGKYLTHKIKFLQDFNIPDAVSGGVLAALLFSLCFGVFQYKVEFDLNIRDGLLIIFFTTIGLSAQLKTLVKGGRPLLILLIMAISYLIVQNITGVAIAALTGLKLPIGLLAGSISLSGGHGTVIAWSPLFKESYGIANAAEIGIASATFGLVFGGIVGGPIAKFLINKNQLQANNPNQDLSIGIKDDQKNVIIDYNTMLNSVLVINLAIGLGLQINAIATAIGLKLPVFVGCLLGGIILTNTVPLVFKHFPWPSDTPSLALISDVSLGLFLAMSLMSLQLWTLVDLAGPIALLLFVQLLMITVYTIFVAFPVMGKNYDAAVISAGYSGLALGATPTAMANMTAVTEHFGASPQAFIIVPLVGAFFMDIANALVIQNFLNFLSFYRKFWV